MIKNIIFDFGGVLLDLDFKKSFDAFKILGFQKIESMFSQFYSNNFFKNLETGSITPDTFYTKLKLLTPQNPTNEQLRKAWNAMLLDYRIESLNFLEILKHKYQLFLLSNTNAIHYDRFSKKLKETTSYPSLEYFFTKTYYSHVIHKRKPDKETYAFILNNAGIHANETLFIDDTITNLPTAEILGIQTLLLGPHERIEDIPFT